MDFLDLTMNVNYGRGGNLKGNKRGGGRYNNNYRDGYNSGHYQNRSGHYGNQQQAPQMPHVSEIEGRDCSFQSHEQQQQEETVFYQVSYMEF
jgi:hypothetical protein